MRHFRTFIVSALFLALFVLFASCIFAQSDKGETMSQQHRSKIAEVARQLVVVAGKDRNIGEEVRQIAQDQNDSNERATKAMEAVETRGKFKTLLLGTDYKNIGALRSELVTTQNHIDRLTKAKERATSETVKAGLDAQIAALKEAQSNVESFIKENESKFSFLGWVVRLFNR